MRSVLILAPVILILASAPADRPSEDRVALIHEGARDWLVAVFPAYRLPGEEPTSVEPSIRERMWRRFGPEGEGSVMARKYLGSGVVVDATGEIITSNAVIEPGAGSVGVGFCDGKTLKAAVVARYERGNLALLKVEGGSFTPAPLAERDPPRPGEVVFTAGNVLDSIGIDGTPSLSRGVIARLGRASGDAGYPGWAIETDAAVNVGSYGGALVNLEGKVIGIVDSGFSVRRWLGQAIPIDVVREILPDLRKGWTPRHTIGIRTESAAGGGVTVIAVEEGGPGAEAGLRPGDRILEADGREVTGPREIDGLTARLPVGTPIRMRIARGEESLEIRVRIGKE